jgi:DNA replication protein DnaC
MPATNNASTVLTSNKSFEEWGEILGAEVMVAALIDRLMHHCHVVMGHGSRNVRAHFTQSTIAHNEARPSNS